MEKAHPHQPNMNLLPFSFLLNNENPHYNQGTPLLVFPVFYIFIQTVFFITKFIHICEFIYDICGSPLAIIYSNNTCKTFLCTLSLLGLYNISFLFLVSLISYITHNPYAISSTKNFLFHIHHTVMDYFQSSLLIFLSMIF